MTSPITHTRAPKALAASWQRLHLLLGFQNGYNFVLWCFLALGLLGFTLSRAPYLDYYGVFCKQNSLTPSLHAAPGECYFFLNGGQEQVGMMMHIFAIIPCCLLLFFQFVPVIRQRAVLFHRVNGYIVILLMAVALAGGLMATSNSFGGEVAFQVANVLLGASVTICLALAVISIRRLQIDQHRAWMLRAWVLASSIITMRLIQNIAGRAVSGQGYTSLRPCAQINSDGVLPQPVIENAWPNCAAYFSGANPDQQVLVKANYYGLPIEVNVALSIASGASAFIALILHALGVETYLRLTPAESDRLRHVSFRKQSARAQMYSVSAGPAAPGSEDSINKTAPHDDCKGGMDSDSVSEKHTETGSRE